MTDATERTEAMQTRARRFGAWYVAEHQLRGMQAYGWTIVMTGIGSPALYLLGIGLGLATFLDQPIADGANGPVSYLLFVAPALLATVGRDGGDRRVHLRGDGGVQVAPDLLGHERLARRARRRSRSGLILAVLVRMIFTTTAYYLLMVAFGAVGDPWGAAWMPLVGVLGGMAFGLPLMAYSASLTEDKGQFALVNRFVFTPMFLFSGTFFPLTTLPRAGCSGSAGSRRCGTRARSGGRCRTACRRGRGRSAGTTRSSSRTSLRRLGARAPRVPTEAALMAVDVDGHPPAGQRRGAVRAQRPVGRGARAAGHPEHELAGHALGLLRAGVLPVRHGGRARHLHRRRRAAVRRRPSPTPRTSRPRCWR